MTRSAVIRPAAPRRTRAGPCEPSRHSDSGGPTGPHVLTTPARRLPSRVLDATKSYLVSCVWLTNTIDRIVKESSPTTVLRSSTWLGSNLWSNSWPRLLSLDAVGRCQVPSGHPPRPSFRRQDYLRGESYSSRLRPQVNSLERFFSKSFEASPEAGIPRPRLDAFGRCEWVGATHPGRRSGVGRLREARAMLPQKTPGSTPHPGFSRRFDATAPAPSPAPHHNCLQSFAFRRGSFAWSRPPATADVLCGGPHRRRCPSGREARTRPGPATRRFARRRDGSPRPPALDLAPRHRAGTFASARRSPTEGLKYHDGDHDSNHSG